MLGPSWSHPSIVLGGVLGLDAPAGQQHHCWLSQVPISITLPYKEPRRVEMCDHKSGVHDPCCKGLLCRAKTAVKSTTHCCVDRCNRPFGNKASHRVSCKRSPSLSETRDRVGSGWLLCPPEFKDAKTHKTQKPEEAQQKEK
ncbi:Piso0_003547 [Millerozyma farinosa CBS 7064]|uniref:Piso0_003547 protein n=1 Tax=Pichia sorbitophila (strain ATCC MYA-4447 / BCRC 22081 / CBS 7064 / NBRC 10061 / NRRL Y-12695) TaxID=559304 RepID=G8YJD6_PICSO|nr:Piso0_003547 [Millerozyma farinosa CBS 7064]CCE81196.1 Piso0_003547 [Millerozyma farinosa CBS 7064]